MNTSATVLEQQAVGDRFSLPLTASEGCRLVLVAWGTSVSTRLGTGTYASAQSKTVSSSSVSSLDATSLEDMKKMPYYQYLENVKITSDGKIRNPDGTDVRLRLQRLASRISFSWDYRMDGYELNQIYLQSIPTDYKVIPSPDATDHQAYPSLLDPFTTIRLSADEVKAGRYACWIPANVRGSNSAATSPLYRTKQTAPVGSSFINFIAIHTADAKKKLDYRIYLGGTATSDFNVYGNHDYDYSVLFRHQVLPVDDKRVTIIDPIPASENNHNLVPTANCFRVAPGGAFCFNPYLFYAGGAPADNALLQGWCGGEAGSVRIRSVKMLWQTKENGDVGDPVMGVVNAADDHTNIVELENGESFADARIYCRVASNTGQRGDRRLRRAGRYRPYPLELARLDNRLPSGGQRQRIGGYSGAQEI